MIKNDSINDGILKVFNEWWEKCEPFGYDNPDTKKGIEHLLNLVCEWYTSRINALESKKECPSDCKADAYQMCNECRREMWQKFDDKYEPIKRR